MASTIDQQFVEFVAKSVVSKPDSVEVKRTIDEKGVLLELTVDPEDLGRVIGKRGATAQSLRTLLRALGTKNDARYNLKIVDNGPQTHPAAVAPASSSQADDTSSKEDTVKDDNDNLEDKKEGVIDEDNDTQNQHTEEENDDQEEKESESISKTRKELADLDDLDI